MRIAVNTRFLLSRKMEGFGWYTYEVVKRMVEQHPEHEFIFFFDRAFDPKFVFGPNVTPVVLFPQARHPLLFRWWFNYSVTKALKRYKADVFFSPDGYLSLRTNVPQIPVIHDLNFEHHPKDLPRKHRVYYKKFFPLFARKAAHILTVSEYSKQDIVRTYGIPESEITVAWNGAAEAFVPLDKESIEKTRNAHSGGRPYFIFVGAIHPRKNVGTLLEAFAAFARKNSDIDLLVVGTDLWKNAAVQPSENVIGVQNRIHFTGHVALDELTKLMGSAFAMVYIPYFEGFGIPLVEAMRCGIPIVSGNLTSLPEVAGDAAIYVDPLDTSAVTECMLELTENEELYREFAERSLKRSTIFSWNHTASGAWNVIEGVYQQQIK